MGDGSWVGVDLHARSAVAAVLDGASGELRTERVAAASEPLLHWLGGLPAPARVVYEAGPTGFELARACVRAGIGCLVAAPGKIPRAPAERVKTDRRDAERLAAAAAPGRADGGAGARRARGADPRPCPRARGRPRRSDAGAAPALQAALAARVALGALGLDARARALAPRPPLRRAARALLRRELRRRAGGESAPRQARPRDRRGRGRAGLRGHGRPALLPARHLDAERARADRRAGRLAPVRARPPGRFPRSRPERAIERRAATAGADHQGRQRPRPSPPGRGRLAPTAAAAPERRPRRPPRRAARRRPCRSRGGRAAPAPTLVGPGAARQATPRRTRRGRARARRPLLETGDDGVATASLGEGEESAPARRGEERPAGLLRATHRAMLDPRERLRSRSHTRSCGPDPRISV